MALFVLLYPAQSFNTTGKISNRIDITEKVSVTYGMECSFYPKSDVFHNGWRTTQTLKKLFLYIKFFNGTLTPPLTPGGFIEHQVCVTSYLK